MRSKTGGEILRDMGSEYDTGAVFREPCLGVGASGDKTTGARTLARQALSFGLAIPEFTYR